MKRATSVSGTRFSYLKKTRGLFTNGVHAGEGTEYYSNGNIMYDGLWSEDKWNGFGTYYSECKRVIYRGYYKDNHPHGKGVEYYKNEQIKYDGERFNGKWNGFGTKYFDTGIMMYRGTFKEGKPHGRGVAYHDNGQAKYDGEWDNGNWNNFGSLYDENGEIFYRLVFFFLVDCIGALGIWGRGMGGALSIMRMGSSSMMGNGRMISGQGLARSMTRMGIF
jgi:hypothetical protein